jgi:hypothetical protein
LKILLVLRGGQRKNIMTVEFLLSSNIQADRSLFSGRRRAVQGWRIIKNSRRRIIKKSGRRIIINIRHNYMHDVTRSKSGGVRKSEVVECGGVSEGEE